MKAVEHPVAGVDYPSTFQALDEWFRDEVACRAYIRRLRWPTGFCCPDCGVVGEPWAMAGGWLRCRACRRETSITAGTISKEPLHHHTQDIRQSPRLRGMKGIPTFGKFDASRRRTPTKPVHRVLTVRQPNSSRVACLRRVHRTRRRDAAVRSRPSGSGDGR